MLLGEYIAISHLKKNDNNYFNFIYACKLKHNRKTDKQIFE